MTRFASSSDINRSACTVALVLTMCAPFALAPTIVVAQDHFLGANGGPSFDAQIAEASNRFGIPDTWISAVIEVESAGDPRAISSAGAMGLMQIMPATWAGLRRAHGLGDDPFDPRENILAGTAYLRAMYDRFGSPGFLAAYNAGPARYEDFLTSERPLPAETRNYLSVLEPIIGAQEDGSLADELPLRSQDWREAPLFAATPIGRMDAGESNLQSSDQEGPRGIFVSPTEQEMP
ncbi:lytic transglycosylase domain-containing protein [Gymnodinialimonas hymeniacidonis]|uniref:lytic transglycosylase domain-containing protein n=1 Tax=Gymnodinialimonas hymeniacidonis TaxID=3126508 RepID=UPI0034C5FE19